MHKVLIIADSETKIILETMLDPKKYEILYAAKGSNGIKSVQEHSPELIFIEQSLPHIDSVELCQTIRNTSLMRKPYLIVLSGRGEENVTGKALENGADDVMQKPFEKEELAARLFTYSRIRNLYQALDKDSKKIESILDITDAIATTLESTAVLHTIIKKAAEVTRALRCSIIIVISENEGYVLASHEIPVIKDMRLNLNKYPEIKEAIKIKKHVVIDDLTAHPLTQKVIHFIGDLKNMSVLVLPIVWEEEVTGILFLRRAQTDNSFTETEIKFCQIMANSSYHAMRDSLLFEELAKEKEGIKTATDRLTKLYTHHFFCSRMDEEFSRSVRYGTPLSLIMADIDDFKKINDTHGHRIGDKVLKDIASIIKKIVRKTDIVARYGGEEFAIMLPNTPLNGAEEDAERIREAIAGHSYAALTKEIISMSFGVTAYPYEGAVKNSSDLIKIAEAALYEAKRGGKNKVVAMGHR